MRKDFIQSRVWRVLAWIETQKPWCIFGICLALVALLGILDIYTGRDFLFYNFYILPLFLAAWCCGFKGGALVSVACSSVWIYEDYCLAPPYLHPLIPIWNVFVKLGVFLLFAYLVGALRKFIQSERDHHAELDRRSRELSEINALLSAANLAGQRDKEKLAQQAAELQRSNSELEQFASVASHDLREPLRMVHGYVDLLAKRYKGRLDPQADKYIHYAVDGAVRMSSLIDKLLAFARAGKMEEPSQALDLDLVVQEALANLKRAVEDSRAKILVESLPTVQGRKQALVQVIQNLIANAIKFRAQTAPQICVRGGTFEREWVVEVRDNGVGFPSDAASRIFKMFQRLHRQEEYPGSGIGLAIAQKLIEQHGGRIWAISQPGEGATFYFSLPRSDQNSPSPPEKGSASSREPSVAAFSGGAR